MPIKTTYHVVCIPVQSHGHIFTARGETILSNDFSEDQMCNGLVFSFTQVTYVSWLFCRGTWPYNTASTMVLASRQCISMLDKSDTNVRRIDYAFPMLEISLYNDNTVQLRYSNRAVTY